MSLLRIQAAKKRLSAQHMWRGIDWRKVSKIEGDHCHDVVVSFKDAENRNPLTLTHYPGEDTYRRAEVQLHMARERVW